MEANELNLRGTDGSFKLVGKPISFQPNLLIAFMRSHYFSWDIRPNFSEGEKKNRVNRFLRSRFLICTYDLASDRSYIFQIPA